MKIGWSWRGFKVVRAGDAAGVSGESDDTEPNTANNLSRISLAISLDHSHTRLWPHKSWAMTVVAVVADDQGGQWVSRPP